MFNRVGGFFIGFMCLLYCISMLANKNVKVGEKFFKFDDTGDLGQNLEIKSEKQKIKFIKNRFLYFIIILM